MTDLLLRRGTEPRVGAEGQDDYDVIGDVSGGHGLIIGQIFRASMAPAATPWMRRLTYEEREASGMERTREAAMPKVGRVTLELKRGLTDSARYATPARHMTGPIRLTDEQLDAIMRAARPLAPADRGAFLQAVAEGLRGREVGDGAVYLAICAAQRQHWQPPLDAPKIGKWVR
jgi:hypothetical protein